MDSKEWTNSKLKRVEKRITNVYRKAAKEMREKQQKALKEYARDKEAREKALDDTKEAKAKHQQWLKEQAWEHTRMGALSDQLAQAASRANRKAVDIANDALPTIFAENSNYAAFEIDSIVGRDTMYTLLDEDTVRNLMQLGKDDVLIREVVESAEKLQEGMERVQSVRKAEHKAAKDIDWNRQKFNSAITQGILQGESISNIVRRTESVFNGNRKAAIRAARTATTSAENSGRMRSYDRAKRLGIPLVIEWIATLDGRTRDSHRLLDGEKIKLGEKFKTEFGEIEYPGDSTAHPRDVWNCRCAIAADVEGFEESDGLRWSKLPGGLTYEEWRGAKSG